MPWPLTTDIEPRRRIELLDHGFVRLDDALADDLSVVNGARVSFARRKTRDGRVRRGADPLPDARPARQPVRAQRLPLPRPLPDLRRPRVVSPPDRLVQRVQPPLREGDRRLLRPRRRRRAHPGRQARRLHASSRSTPSSPSAHASSSRRSTSRPTRPTRSSSRPASRASSRAPCCRSAPTPSSTGPSTPAR